MDTVLAAFRRIRWTFAEDDPAALAELEYRIAKNAHRGKTINYSDLARGVPFDLPGFQSRPHLIDVHDWQKIDGRLIGDFLGFISYRSYERAQIMSSALVVNKGEGQPGDGFYRLLVQLGLIPTVRSEFAPVLWGEHRDKALEWFATHR